MSGRLSQRAEPPAHAGSSPPPACPRVPLRDAFASWVGNARKVSSRTSTARPARRSGRSSGSARATEVREWARANGYTVNDRGRISQEIQTAFDAAH